VLAHTADQIAAGHIGQTQFEHDYLGSLLGDFFQSLFAGIDRRDGELRALEHAFEPAAGGTVGIDNQNVRHHRLP